MILLGIMIDKLIQAVGWMLVHSLWQGCVLALLAACILSLIPHKRSSLHYGVLLFAMASFIIVCAGTFFIYWNQPADNNIRATGAVLIERINTISFSAASSPVLHSIQSFIAVNAPLLVFCWFLFFCFRIIKNLAGWTYAKRICREDIYSPPAEWQTLFDKLVAQMNLKKNVRLLESGRVNYPITLGFLKPVVLMPLGVLCALPPSQVEVVLRHELAHIRRNDYLVNLFQLITESVFFFNPGLLWLSVQLREKREFSCDDIALTYADNKEEYLYALLHFKSLAIKGLPIAVGFPGEPTQLRKRVIRILSGNNKTGLISMASLIYTALAGLLFFTAIYMTGRRQTTTDIMATAQIVNIIPVLKLGQEKFPDIASTNDSKKNVATKTVIKQTAEEHIQMDSTVLSMLTGEFNTIYGNTHYVIGVAKSSITYLKVDGEVISPEHWHQYDNVFAGIINRFKIGMEKASSSTQPLTETPIPPVKKMQLASG
jgi:beta-lactamase regulating signal transducer with metallopeptidase domain